MLRQHDVDFHQQVSKLILLCIEWHSKSTKAELFAVWRSLRNIDCDFTFQCFDLSLSAEESSIQFNGEVTVESVSTPVKFRMRRNLDGEIEVAVRTAA